MDALELAIRMEKDAIDFYKDAVKRTRHPFGKRMFEGFIEDEKRHLKALDDIFSGLGLRMDPQSPMKNVRSIFEELRDEMMQRIEADSDEIDAIKVALDIEKKGYDLYRKMVEESTDEKIKELFDLLSKEEEEHFNILQNTLSFLEDTGNWFMWEEHSIIDGGTPWA
ncbi:MAG: ferritin family protein [Thermodesulfovibrionia bacterium]